MNPYIMQNNSWSHFTLTLIQQTMKFKQLKDVPSLQQLEHKSQINLCGLNTIILCSDITYCLQQ